MAVVVFVMLRYMHITLKLVFRLRYERLQKTCSIALVGKYTKLRDCYASVFKALEHSALAINHKLNLMVSPWLVFRIFQSFTVISRVPEAGCVEGPSRLPPGLMSPGELTVLSV